ncbi:hypothetical protein HGRIS_014842 [Hohenbuehelia grisea]|uniref:Uncharacterized protein n=1 Tax=Hohenbuehelia grisea TaxID=104357 RepID=A0ABR3IQV1_9AGAR
MAEGDSNFAFEFFIGSDGGTNDAVTAYPATQGESLPPPLPMVTSTAMQFTSDEATYTGLEHSALVAGDSPLPLWDDLQAPLASSDQQNMLPALHNQAILGDQAFIRRQSLLWQMLVCETQIQRLHLRRRQLVSLFGMNV